MLRPMARSSFAAWRVAAALSFALVACGPTPPPKNGPDGPAVIANVADKEFATALHRVLSDGSHTLERQGLLAGVIRQQLAHAARKFSLGYEDRGTDATMGAFYLLRLGEDRADLIDAASSEALRGAMIRVGARGDEGRAAVLLSLRIASLPPGSPERKEAEEHLAALTTWATETRTGGPAVVLGVEQRAKVNRALIEPSETTVTQAVDAIIAWMARAAEYDHALRMRGERPTRMEAEEAERALNTGGATVASLYLRYGDAKGAADAIDQRGIDRLISPLLYDRIRRAATQDSARAWQSLALTLANADGTQDAEWGPATAGVPAEVAQAGVWGASLEAYRRDPTSFRTAVLLSAQLIRFGMSEAVPLVAAGAISQQGSGANSSSNPAEIAAAVDLVLGALQADAEVDDVEACHRTFAAAEPLLAIANAAKTRFEPRPARARALMASVELRAGDLPGARTQLESVAKTDPSVGAFTMLAMVERQSQRRDAALSLIDKAIAAPDAASSPADVAAAHLVAFEIHRESGASDRAERALSAALQTALTARQQAQTTEVKLRAERVLSRVLDGYGDAKGAQRAMDRALTLAEGDRDAFGATVLDAVARAFVRKDLDAARAALRRGIDGDIAEADLVYGGLWLMFLEREMKATPDGSADQALRRATTRGAWSSKLAAWASGRLTEQDLAGAALNAVQRVEAAFYAAIAKRAAGDPAAEAKLRDVATSPVMELVEVQLARELTAPRLHTALPVGTRVP